MSAFPIHHVTLLSLAALPWQTSNNRSPVRKRLPEMSSGRPVSPQGKLSPLHLRSDTRRQRSRSTVKQAHQPRQKR
ncbi:MAG: hypothetical protein AAGJ55_09950, partial [Cyanobacteria bacterium J06555_12]